MLAERGDPGRRAPARGRRVPHRQDPAEARRRAARGHPLGRGAALPALPAAGPGDERHRVHAAPERRAREAHRRAQRRGRLGARSTASPAASAPRRTWSSCRSRSRTRASTPAPSSPSRCASSSRSPAAPRSRRSTSRQLRFYIHGERRLQDDLRLWLGAHVDGIALASVDAAGRDTTVATLPAKTLKLVGFAEDEGLIPYPRTVYPGFRLLQEYFTLPQKFAFFDVTGLEALPADKMTDRFAIIIQFKDGLPTGTRVTKDNFRLFCSPVVNLFEHPTDPIKPDPGKHEYLVAPHRARRRRPTRSTAVDNVVAIARRTSQRVEIPPFFSFQHELDPDAAARARLLPDPPPPRRDRRRRRRLPLVRLPAGRRHAPRVRRHQRRGDLHQPPPAAARSRSATCACRRRPRPRSPPSRTSPASPRRSRRRWGASSSGACSRTWR